MRAIDERELIHRISVLPDLRAFSTATIGKCIKDCRTVTIDDLRPKGRWEPVDARYSRCTNCKRERNIRTQIGWEFCPSCGAKMEYGVADE